jgi:hypothetical protein
MIKIGRQKVVCFFALSFLLFEIGLQFYLDDIKQLVGMYQTLLPILNSTSSGLNERYQLLERYTHDSLSLMDPPFKRILFWNEVI